MGKFIMFAGLATLALNLMSNTVTDLTAIGTGLIFTGGFLHLKERRDP